MVATMHAVVVTAIFVEAAAVGPGGRGSYLESRENQQENEKESVQHDTCGGKVNQRTAPILLDSGRKGDLGDRAGAYVEKHKSPTPAGVRLSSLFHAT